MTGRAGALSQKHPGQGFPLSLDLSLFMSCETSAVVAEGISLEGSVSHVRFNIIKT